MNRLLTKLWLGLPKKNSGMELVQVAILIAIAIVIGLLFSKQIAAFVNSVFSDLMDADF